MSMIGNIAVEGAMKELLRLVESGGDLSDGDLLEKLIQQIESIRKAASTGYY